jgi:hypothetical protein
MGLTIVRGAWKCSPARSHKADEPMRVLNVHCNLADRERCLYTPIRSGGVVTSNFPSSMPICATTKCTQLSSPLQHGHPILHICKPKACCRVLVAILQWIERSEVAFLKLCFAKASQPLRPWSVAEQGSAAWLRLSAQHHLKCTADGRLSHESGTENADWISWRIASFCCGK